jgi:hypothetical protein
MIAATEEEMRVAGEKRLWRKLRQIFQSPREMWRTVTSRCQSAECDGSLKLTSAGGKPPDRQNPGLEAMAKSVESRRMMESVQVSMFEAHAPT